MTRLQIHDEAPEPSNADPSDEKGVSEPSDKVSYEFPVFRIMERKGIEKGIQLGRTEGIQLG